VVWQLGEFREFRAAGELQKVAAFSPRPSYGKAGRTRATLVAGAREALNKIQPRQISTNSSSSPQSKWWQFWK
jgi:hypothetical protein